MLLRKLPKHDCFVQQTSLAGTENNTARRNVQTNYEQNVADKIYVPILNTFNFDI